MDSEYAGGMDETRHVFRTQSNICDRAFLEKLSTAFIG